MDTESERLLVQILKKQRVASLGTLRDGGPLVSQVLFAAAADFLTFYLHISRLAQHTQDLSRDSRASMMFSQPDDGVNDPQTLARISMRGQALILPHDDPIFAEARRLYLEKFPQAAVTFQLGDFSLYRFIPEAIRFVAGFGKTFNLIGKDLSLAAELHHE